MGRAAHPGRAEVWWCGLAARAALWFGHVRQCFLDVLAATGPGDLAALVAGAGLHGDLLQEMVESVSSPPGCPRGIIRQPWPPSVWLGAIRGHLGDRNGLRPVFMALTLVFVVPFISHQYSLQQVRRPAVVSTVVLYGCALVAFTLFPFPDFAGDYCDAHADVSHWQLNPFRSFLDLVDYAASNGCWPPDLQRAAPSGDECRPFRPWGSFSPTAAVVHSALPSSSD